MATPPRKRLRLSDDEMSPSPSSPNSPLIEVLPPEDVGASLTNAIEINDYDMDLSYADQIGLNQPEDGLALWSWQLRSQQYLHIDAFNLLAQGINGHVQSTHNEEDRWLRKYLADADFFERLAKYAIELLKDDAPINSTITTSSHKVFNATRNQHMALMILCARIVRVLPKVIGGHLRRDSATDAPRKPEYLPLLQYLKLIVRLTLKDTPAMMFLWQHFDVDADAIAQASIVAFLRVPNALDALVRTFNVLLDHCKDVSDSWEYLILIQKFMNGPVRTHLSELPLSDFPCTALEDYLCATARQLVPAIATKHPNALPATMHSLAVENGSFAISILATTIDGHGAVLYHRYLQSANDGLLIGASNTSREEQLDELTGGDPTVLGELLVLVWVLQTCWSFIKTGNTGVAARGIEILGAALLRRYQDHKTSPEHPVMQYAVRFLRTNDVVSHLLSAQMDADHVAHSGNIIGFLAATNYYTEQETDKIWSAAIAQDRGKSFNRACFQLLHMLSGILNVEHKMIVLRKYATTPMRHLLECGPANDYLRALYESMQPSMTPKQKLMAAVGSMEILQQVAKSSSAPSRTQIWAAAMCELDSAITGSLTSLGTRVELYKRAVAHINEHDDDAACGMLIMRMFLCVQTLSPGESQTILDMLPLSSVINDFPTHEVHTEIPEVTTARLEVAIRLLTLTETVDSGLEHQLWDRIVGPEAPSRDSAWSMLRTLMSFAECAPIVRRGVEHFVPHQPAGCATPALVLLLQSEVRLAQLSSIHLSSSILDLPSWQQLVRIAVGNQDTAGQQATRSVCDLLFSTEPVFTLPTALETQKTFAKHLIEQDCLQPERFKRLIDLLLNLVQTSRHSVKSVPPSAESQQIASADESSPSLDVEINIYGPVVQEKFHLRAQASTKICELSTVLVEHTGTTKHLIIVSGKAIDLDELADKTFEEAGVRHSGSVLIRPRYIGIFDLEKALKSPGPLERTLVDGAERFDGLLDGPLGEEAFRFLQSIPVPSRARKGVQSGEASELLPPGRPYRAAYSVYVLDVHLKDLCSVGAPNGAFVKRGLSMLTGHILDMDADQRSLVPALNTFVRFVEEDPGYQAPTELHSRLASIINEATRKDLFIASYCAKVRIQDLHATNDLALHNSVLQHPDQSFRTAAVATISKFSDRTVASRNFFQKVTMAAMFGSLQRLQVLEVLTNLTVNLANSDEVLGNDEMEVRRLINDFFEHLQSYKHSESPKLHLTDNIIRATLTVLVTLVQLLKGFKRDLQLESLGRYIFQDLLFPPLNGQRDSLVDAHTRQLALGLVRSTTTNRDALMDDVISAIQEVNRDALIELDTYSLRSAKHSAGLVNYGSQMCFINSLLQQLFANLQLRHFVLNTAIGDGNSSSFLAKLQPLFVRMQESRLHHQQAPEVLTALDFKIGEQDDAHSAYTRLLGAIESSLPDSEARRVFNTLFSGKQISQTQGACGHISSKEQEFSSLEVQVKGMATLQDGLDDFVSGGSLAGDNRWHCSKCQEDQADNGALVDARTRTCLRAIPDNLTICLKRFESDEYGETNKVNDRFSFPSKIDMARYRLDADKPDEFDLVGVVVHSGYLTGGHYWSHVRMRNDLQNPWIYLEDDRQIRSSSIEEVQKDCFGGRWANGRDRLDSAYILFYQRTSSIEAEVPLTTQHYDDPDILRTLPPRVSMPPYLSTDVDVENRRLYRLFQLADGSFASMVDWLTSIDSISQADGPRHQNMMRMVLLLAERVAKCVPRAWRVSVRALDRLGDKTDGEIVPHVLAMLAQPLRRWGQEALPDVPEMFEMSENVLVDVLKLDDQEIRLDVFSYVARALNAIKQRPISPVSEKSQAGTGSLLQLLPALVSMRQTMEFCDDPVRWHDSLRFWAEIASSGPEETATLIGSGFLEWALEIIYMHSSVAPACKINHPSLAPLAERRQLNLDAVFNLVNALLEHVDLSKTGDTNVIGPEGCVLTRGQTQFLMLETLHKDAMLKNWLLVGCTHIATSFQTQLPYGPGKLVARLASPDADRALGNRLRSWLMDRYRRETQETDPFLQCTLQYVMSSRADDADTAHLFRIVAQELLEWPGHTKSNLTFMSIAANYVPCAVTRCCPIFATKWLLSPKLSEKQVTMLWLQQHIFQHDQMTLSTRMAGTEDAVADNNALVSITLDAIRSEALRALCTSLMRETLFGLVENHSRKPYECAIETMYTAIEWFQKLATTAFEDCDGGELLIPELRVELAQARQMSDAIETWMEQIRDWEEVEAGDEAMGKELVEDDVEASSSEMSSLLDGT